VSRDSADQGGKEADGLGRFLGLERDEVGLSQLDLLIHVIPGRLSLASPALGPDLRFDLIDIVLRRTPRFLHAFTTGSGSVLVHGAMTRFPRSSRRVPTESPGSELGGSGRAPPIPLWSEPLVSRAGRRTADNRLRHHPYKGAGERPKRVGLGGGVLGESPKAQVARSLVGTLVPWVGRWIVHERLHLPPVQERGGRH